MPREMMTFDERSMSNPGALTSEHGQTVGGVRMGWVVIALGAVMAAAAMYRDAAGSAGMIAGVVLALAGSIQSTLVRLGYIKSRTVVKAAAMTKQ